MMRKPEHLGKKTEQDHVEQQVFADRSFGSMNFVQSVPEEYEQYLCFMIYLCFLL